MANYVRKFFIWRWRSASCPPRPLPEDFHALCPRFSLSEAEGAAADFELPEIVRRIVKTKSAPCFRSLDELLAEGTQGNPCSAPSSSNPEAEVAFTGSSFTLGVALSSSSSESSSSKGASSSPSSSEEPPAPGKSVLKRKSRAHKVTEIVAEGSEFPGAPTHSDLQDGLGSHFPDPKVVTTLKRSALEK
ncbi:hypothetical protein Cgig2_022559 [Carnegiea gigantea]|uniref:Uncharacterized protein n=1 Tax=Carnegiea gigantea TaxID=171969 RepID=A0A9Q1KK98_9CARY|nr:hypothetical protein Cgig2_022559 [Carnegiea gigantea]